MMFNIKNILLLIVVLLLGITANAQFYNLSTKDDAAVYPFYKNVITIPTTAALLDSTNVLIGNSIMLSGNSIISQSGVGVFIVNQTIIHTRGYNSVFDQGGADFLLSSSIPSGYVNDTLTVIKIQESPSTYLVRLPEKFVKFSSFNPLLGDLEDDFSTESLETIDSLRKNNGMIWCKALEYCKNIGAELYLNFKDNFEINLLGVPQFEIDNGEVSIVYGNKALTNIVLYPLANSVIRPNNPEGGGSSTFPNVPSINLPLFTTQSGSRVILKDFNIEGSRFQACAQMYKGTLNSGVLHIDSAQWNANTIATPDDDYAKTKGTAFASTEIWSGLWQNLNIGDTIQYQTYLFANIGGASIVTSKDSINRDISLTEISYSDATQAFSAINSGSEIYFYIGWPSVVPKDTIKKYSGVVATDRVAHIEYKLIETDGDYGSFSTTKTQIDIDAVNTKNISTIFTYGGGWTDLSIKNSIISAFIIGGHWSVGGNPAPSLLHMDNIELTNNGYIFQMAPDGTGATESRQGSGIYASPGSNILLENSYIHHNTAAAYRQYTQGGYVTNTWQGMQSKIVNCVFGPENNEYAIYTSDTNPITIEGCSFMGDTCKVNIGYTASIINCKFQDDITMAGGNFPYPQDADETEGYRVVFDNCIFEGEALLRIGWPEEGADRTSVIVQNSDFVLVSPDSVSIDSRIEIGSSSSGTVNNGHVTIKDCSVSIPDGYAVYDPITNTPGDSVIQLFQIKQAANFEVINLKQKGRINSTVSRPIFAGYFGSVDGVVSNVRGIVRNSDIPFTDASIRARGRTSSSTIKYIDCDIRGGMDTISSELNRDMNIVSFRDATKLITLDSKTFLVDPAYRNYNVEQGSSDTIKNIFVDMSHHGEQMQYAYLATGIINLTSKSKDTLVILPYSQDATSNIVANNIIYLYPYQTVTLKGNGYEPIYAGSIGHIDSTLFTTTTATVYEDETGNSDAFRSNKYVEGTLSVTYDGSTYYADEEGNFINDIFFGFFSLIKQGWHFEFKNAVSAGKTFVLHADRKTNIVHRGYWSYVSGGSVLIDTAYTNNITTFFGITSSTTHSIVADERIGIDADAISGNDTIVFNANNLIAGNSFEIVIDGTDQDSVFFVFNPSGHLSLNDGDVSLGDTLMVSDRKRMYLKGLWDGSNYIIIPYDNELELGYQFKSGTGITRPDSIFVNGGDTATLQFQNWQQLDAYFPLSVDSFFVDSTIVLDERHARYDLKLNFEIKTSTANSYIEVIVQSPSFTGENSIIARQQTFPKGINAWNKQNVSFFIFAGSAYDEPVRIRFTSPDDFSYANPDATVDKRNHSPGIKQF